MHKKLLIIAFICALPALTLFIYYGAYGGLEHRLRVNQGYSAMQANGIKHAYASYGVYSSLKKIGASDEFAESVVFNLGVFNEWLENIIYESSEDTREEVMRDLHNNWAGMSAAQWYWYKRDQLEENGLTFIKTLMKEQVLLAERPSLSYEVSGISDRSLAESWLYPRRSVIRSDVQNALERAFSDASLPAQQ